MKAYIGIKYHEDYRNKDVVDRISSVLEIKGYKTSCIVRDMNNSEKIKSDSCELMETTFKEIDECDFVVIDLTEKGVGVGIEAGYAFAKGIPIITIAKQGSDISETLEGISSTILIYDDIDEIDCLFEKL